MNIEYLMICLTSMIVAMITLFSGFGLSTILMPVFAIFFPIPVAIAATAMIHLANNLFKLILVGKYAKMNVVLKFGVPAAAASALGAYLLGYFANLPPLFTYHIYDFEFKATLIGVLVGCLIMFASFFELLPQLTKLSFDPAYIPYGGLLSGFFGGISGNQGILRSAFLIKSG
jgi:uncharacterized membrane protein YfcA